VRRATAILAATAFAAPLASAPCSCALTPVTRVAPAQSASSGGEADEHAREMARDKGTYFVDRALYDEAMAQYKR
jgi:hypothetical protein